MGLFDWLFGDFKDNTHKKYVDRIISEPLHTNELCRGCIHYKVENHLGSPAGYCYHVNNWERSLVYTTMNYEGEPFESVGSKQGPDEINPNGECEWRNDPQKYTMDDILKYYCPDEPMFNGKK
jgi:hypothetical protein